MALSPEEKVNVENEAEYTLFKRGNRLNGVERRWLGLAIEGGREQCKSFGDWRQDAQIA